MQLIIQNPTSATVTVMGQTIASSESYTIPTVDVKAWAGDLGVRVHLLMGLLTLVDATGVYPVNPGDCSGLLNAIVLNYVGTS